MFTLWIASSTPSTYGRAPPTAQPASAAVPLIRQRSPAPNAELMFGRVLDFLRRT